MLTFRHHRRNPAGLSRREFFRVGGLGVAGVTLADVLRAQASSPTKRPKSVIYVVLDGGPSHIDMWDLKPDAPSEYRGPFHPGATAIPGVRICDLMPRQAARMDRLALLRGIKSVENDHFLSEVYTGLPRTSGNRPAFGSVVSRLSGGFNGQPAYVSLNRPTTERFEYEKPYYVGAGHAPFRPFENALADLTPAKSLATLEDRKQLLTQFDTLRRDLDSSGTMGGLDQFQRQALDIVTSPKVREAFDLSKEPPKTIDRFGVGKYPHQTVKDLFYGWEGKQFVLARRLVEAGVRVVTLRVGSWDHHSGPTSDIFAALRCLMPLLDASVGALLDDLTDRGLFDDVLVVVLGEFGRTPKITPQGPGREHWADAGCAVLFGGGLKAGLVLGETDARAEQVKAGLVTFQNVVATIYHLLGVEVGVKLPDFNGRPQHLLDDRTPIRQLLA